MSWINEWEFRVKRLLFDERMPVNKVVDMFVRAEHVVRFPKYNIVVKEDGVTVREEIPGEFEEMLIPPDEEWLREQIQSVHDHPEEHGFPADALVPKPPKQRYRYTPRKDSKPPQRGG